MCSMIVFSQSLFRSLGNMIRMFYLALGTGGVENASLGTLFKENAKEGSVGYLVF